MDILIGYKTIYEYINRKYIMERSLFRVSTYSGLRQDNGESWVTGFMSRNLSDCWELFRGFRTTPSHGDNFSLIEHWYQQATPEITIMGCLCLFQSGSFSVTKIVPN